MSKVLLNLDTLVVRPKIAIDGKQYEILSPDELPVLTTHMLGSKGKRMEELMANVELAGPEKAELTTVVHEISDTIMSPVPASIRDKLSDTQRITVIQTFSTLLLTNKAGTAAAMLRSLLPDNELPNELPQNPPTGAKRSRASSASTGGRRAGGSTKRRSRS